MKNKNIFLAEDDIIIAMDLKNILKKNGFNNVSFFSNGNNLLEKALAQPPDLIIADILLANKTNGLKSVEKLWQQFDVPVLFISALNTKKFESKFDPFKCDFLSKPFKESDVLNSLNRLLNIPLNSKSFH